MFIKPDKKRKFYTDSKKDNDFECQINRDRKKEEYVINNTEIYEFNNRYIESLFRIHFSFIELDNEEQEKIIKKFILQGKNEKIKYYNENEYNTIII